MGLFGFPRGICLYTSVDGTRKSYIHLDAMPVHRRVTYKLYPSASQAAELDRVTELHRVLYNAALQERRDAWRLKRASIGFAAQCKSLTQIRRDDPEYAALNAQSLQQTLRRLDRAFAAFFRRLEAGETPGYPRFKAEGRFPGFRMGWQNGWRFVPGDNWRHGRLRLSGIGEMRARGAVRTPGRVVTCDILRKTDGWFLSLLVECDPRRERTGGRVAGMDLGVETLATLCYGPHDFTEIPNDRLQVQEQDAMNAAQRAVSKAQRGKRSKRLARAKRLLTRSIVRLHARRKDRSHKFTARLVSQHAVIVTEDLDFEGMTRSAGGSVDRPGKQVRQKAGLNRELLDAAPGAIMYMARYKAEEAGTRLILVDPREHRPSQTDPVSGAVRKKALSERTHVLPDGRVIGRDQAAAWVLWNIGQRILGQERASSERAEVGVLALATNEDSSSQAAYGWRR